MDNSNLPFEWAKCLILGNGNKVQNLRMLKKLTPEGLAKSADVSEESLKSIECQKIELINTDLTKIANPLIRNAFSTASGEATGYVIDGIKNQYHNYNK